MRIIYTAKVIGYGYSRYIHLPKEYFKAGQKFKIIFQPNKGGYELILIPIGVEK